MKKEEIVHEIIAVSKIEKSFGASLLASGLEMTEDTQAGLRNIITKWYLDNFDEAELQRLLQICADPVYVKMVERSSEMSGAVQEWVFLLLQMSEGDQQRAKDWMASRRGLIRVTGTL